MAVRFDVLVEIALSADLTADPSTWVWTDITQYVHLETRIVVSRGRRDWYSQTPPAKCTLTLHNDGGRFVPRNPLGAYYGQINLNTPLRVSVGPAGGSLSVQFTGHVDEWPTIWSDASLNQSLAPITCSGLLRRIQQGGVLRSAMFRANTEGYFGTGTAVAYWSCEDESDATSLASGLDGGSPMAIQGDGVSVGSDSTLPGSEALVRISDTAASSIAGVVPFYTAASSWAIRFAMKIDTEPAVGNAILRWTTGGSLTLWQLVLAPGSPSVLTLQAYTPALVEQLGDTGVNWVDLAANDLYGSWVYFEIDATQNGTSIDWEYNFNFPGGFAFGATGTEPSVTIGNVTQVGMGYGWGSAALTDTSIGHIAVSTDTNFGPGQFALTGYAGETTSQRLIRLDSELSVPTMFGDLSNPSEIGTQGMGPQPTSSAIDQFRQIADTESGILHDGKQGHITILPRALRYNAAVAISADVDAAEAGWPFAATDDDKDVQNDVTARRPGGSSARATSRASIAKVGVYTGGVTVNPQTDAELRDFATWIRHQGTIDDLRYPQVLLNFARASSLIAAWQAADVGSRIQIANPPSELPPDTLDLIIEGYTEVFDNWTWTASLFTSPATAWQTFELEGSGNLGRPGADGSYLLTGATSGATSVLVATRDAGPLWSTTAEPYDWAVAGERVTATAVTTQTAAFVAAGTAAHADNASVTPSMPAGVQQGDLLLVFAAIRSSGTGTVNTPSGYSALVTFGNVKLLGKIHTGTESAPTVTFAGGASGDTTSAHMAAFRYAQLAVVASATSLNGSAQNITVPGLPGVDRNNLLLLWLGWKQDDWTSVATLSGGFATEIGEPSSTTGNDQGLVWDYFVQTTVGEPGATSFVVTGGASAISRGIALALKTDIQSATVTRAVNAVSKAQSANAAVNLWRPGVLAL